MKRKILLLALITTVSLSNLFAQSTSPAPYCNASFDDAQGFPVADVIFKVSFGSLVNNSNAQYAYPHYVYYNNLTAPTVVKESNYT